MGRPIERHARSLLKMSLCGLIVGAIHLAAGSKYTSAQETTGRTAIDRGRQAYIEERWDQAIPLLQEAANAVPENVEAWLFLASCFDKLGQPDQASKTFRQAIKANPNLVIVHIHTGVQYGLIQIDDQATEARLRALRLEPDFAAAYQSIGLAYARLGRFPEAVSAYQEAIRIKPDYAEAYSNLAVAYHCMHKWGKATQCAREAVRIDSRNAEAHFNLGICLLKAGDRGGALKERNALQDLASSLFDNLNAAIQSSYTCPAARAALTKSDEKK